MVFLFDGIVCCPLVDPPKDKAAKAGVEHLCTLTFAMLRKCVVLGLDIDRYLR